MTSFQTIILTNERDKVAVSMNDAVVDIIAPEIGFRTPAEIGDAKAPSGHLLNTTVPVQSLKEEEKMAPGLIGNLPKGPKEHFASVSGLR